MEFDPNSALFAAVEDEDEVALRGVLTSTRTAADDEDDEAFCVNDDDDDEAAEGAFEGLARRLALAFFAAWYWPEGGNVGPGGILLPCVSL